MSSLQKRPDPIDKQRWRDMDPLVRDRFHEMADHQTKLEGLIAALVLLVPERPETVPLLEERVGNLQRGADRTEQKVDQVNAKIDKKVGELHTKLDTKFDDLTKSMTSLAVKIAAIGAIVGAVIAGGVKVAGLG